MKKGESGNLIRGARIGMAVRVFGCQGGLELYTHKIVEGLLERGVHISVICEENQSDLAHKKLSFHTWAPPSPELSRRQQMLHRFRAASDACENISGLDILHSQHLPLDACDVVTFHNHTIKRLSKVGLNWEQQVNSLKGAVNKVYRLRHKFDEILCRSARVLVFPSLVVQQDYLDCFPFLADSGGKEYLLVRPGASLFHVPEQHTKMPNEALSFVNEAVAGTRVIPASALSPEPFTFLFVGRGFRKKGLDILLAACGILKARKLNFRLLIAGLKEKPPDTLRNLISGLRSSVEYLGFQKDMEAVYRRAQCIVLPSRIEPFGMAPIQAMNYGLVPIVSSVSGVSEVLQDDYDALILPDHLSAGQLAGLMEKAMQDGSKMQALSLAARQTAKKISWEQAVDDTVSAYTLALGALSRHR